MIKRNILQSLLIILILADLSYSFFQFYSTPFDGDLAGGVVPAEDVKPILEHPFGIEALTEEKSYPNPNRFFSHWIFYTYMNQAPLFLQTFVSPLNSAYLASALFKLFLQFSLIYLISIAVTGKRKFFHSSNLLVCVLISALFQTNGYRSYMGIIDPATTYIFFYAFPTALLLFYFLPFFVRQYFDLKTKRYKLLSYLWIPIGLVASLSGPLNPGISLVLVLLIIIHLIRKALKRTETFWLNKIKSEFTQLSFDYYVFLIPISLFSLYSIFLGSYNSINAENSFSLYESFSRLPLGLVYILTEKPGFIILFVSLTINYWIIKTQFYSNEGQKILKIYQWFFLFSCLYILLLPFGGYRTYRPNIVRYDTFIPVTIGFIFLFGKTTFFILQSSTLKLKRWYLPVTILVLFIFTFADKPGFDKNECERKAIQQLVESTQSSVVLIPSDCFLLTWEKVTNPEQSKLNCLLLQKWNILTENKLYTQEKDNSNEAINSTKFD